VAYIHFNFQTKDLGDQPELTLYPLACMHLGSPQCDMKFIREHLGRIKEDPGARWVYMGDGGECVTKLSKGDVYGQLLSPQAQMEALIDILQPIRDRGLFGVRGNHGNRIYKETGLSFDQNLCLRLGLPYLGISTFANVVINRSSYDMFFHHGIDSGTPLAAKIKRAEDFGKYINADAIFTAHSHVAIDLQPAALLEVDNVNRKVRTKLRHQYICGSAYDSRTGYAEDRGYPPLLPSYLAVTFSGRINTGRAVMRQTCVKYVADGQYELQHDYILKYLGKQPDAG